ncbi:MAG TPA: HAD family hydrolase [Candidatus Omnitrophota bacterium]|nr:HAD family hydrolase [Candidatus Omnitrophota bacterium]HPS19567.1 HAD family hydrolase [Candidatus Omnitrophota bacterium]
MRKNIMDKCVFLDRDGVINKDGHGWTEYSYITRPEDFYFLNNVFKALKKFRDHGYKCVVISNQQGVGKGYFTEKQLKEVTAYMMDKVAENGGMIDRAYYCIHTKEEKCNCRKPDTGLFLRAEKDLNIPIVSGEYFFVGDTERDMEAGKKAGLRTVLVLSGKAKAGDEAEWAFKPEFVCEDLLEAFDIIEKEGQNK